MADVGACHTIDTQRHVRGLPCLLGTVNAGAHNTVDAEEARGGSLTVFVWYGS